MIALDLRAGLLLGALLAAPLARGSEEGPPEGWSRATLEDLGLTASVQRYGTAPELRFPFTTRADQVLTDADLTLRLTPDPTLLERVEALVVRVNGETVRTLGHADLVSGAALSLPVDSRLLGERNELELALVPMPSPQAGLFPADGEASCVVSVPAGTWALLEGGTLDTRGSPLPLDSDLSLLPLPFYDPAYDRQARVPVVFTQPPSPTAVRAGALVAGWFGTHTGSRVRFPVTVGEVPEDSAVVLAAGELVLGDATLPAPEAPMLRMVDHPAAPGSNRKLLVLHGATGDDLLEAARGLILGAEAGLHGKDRPVEAPVDVPAPRAAYDAPRWLPAAEQVAFGALPGGEVLRHEGTRGGTVELTFRVAPDLFTWPRDLVRVDVDYLQLARSQELVPTVIVELNGRFVGKLPRMKPHATQPRTEQLELHRSQLRGFNRLQFHVSFGDEVLCAPPQDVDVSTTILPSSRIWFDRTPHFAELPNVESFVEDGFPFTRRPDLAETALVLPDAPLSGELSSALSLAAHFAAVTGVPPWHLAVVPASEARGSRIAGRDVLVIATTDRLTRPELLADDLPLVVRQGRLVARTPPWTRQALDLLGARVTAAEVAALGGWLGGEEVAAVFGAPARTGHGRSAVVVTAATEAALPATPDLIGFAEARAPGGDVLVLADGGRARFRVGAVEAVGEVDRFTRFRWAVASHWLVLVPSALLSMFALAWAWRGRLQVEERRRFALGEEPR